MSASLLLVQALNGLQLGVLLFLIAAGLTLVFGVLDLVNLAHGTQLHCWVPTGGDLCRLDRQFRCRIGAGGAGGLGVRFRAGTIGAGCVADAQPSRPGARHLWPDPAAGGGGPDDLGYHAVVAAGAGVARRHGDADR